MPRKKAIKWLSVPRADLTKCHNKRCEEDAAQDYLCRAHWVTWHNNGQQPAIPATYTGARPTVQNPLQVEIGELMHELDQISSYVAKMRADDAEGLAELAEARQLVEQRIAHLKTRHQESIAPFVEAQRRTSSFFEIAEGRAKKALSLIDTRAEVARSSIVPAAVMRRRPVVNPQKKGARTR